MFPYKQCVIFVVVAKGAVGDSTHTRVPENLSWDDVSATHGIAPTATGDGMGATATRVGRIQVAAICT